MTTTAPKTAAAPAAGKTNGVSPYASGKYIKIIMIDWE
jgi:hypothetical protein